MYNRYILGDLITMTQITLIRGCH